MQTETKRVFPIIGNCVFKRIEGVAGWCCRDCGFSIETGLPSPRLADCRGPEYTKYVAEMKRTLPTPGFC